MLWVQRGAKDREGPSDAGGGASAGRRPGVGTAGRVAVVAALAVGRVLDGRCLATLIREPRAGRGDALLCGGFEGIGFGVEGYSGALTRRRLCAEYDYSDGGPREGEPYDTIRDPRHSEGRHADPDYDKARAELPEQPETLRGRAGGACR